VDSSSPTALALSAFHHDLRNGLSGGLAIERETGLESAYGYPQVCVAIATY
jgi:hypothetical protein